MCPQVIACILSTTLIPSDHGSRSIVYLITLHDTPPRPAALLLVLLLGDLALLDLFLEGVVWDRVQAQDRLVRILDEHVLALVHLEAHVDDGADDAPAIVEVECHLVGEVARLVGEHAEDDVVVVGCGVGAGDETGDWSDTALLS